VLKQVGRYEESIEAYRVAVSHPEEASDYSWRGLAMAFKAMGRLDEAEDAFLRGLAQHPGEPFLDRGLQALRVLKQKIGTTGATEQDVPEGPLDDVPFSDLLTREIEAAAAEPQSKSFNELGSVLVNEGR